MKEFFPAATGFPTVFESGTNSFATIIAAAATGTLANNSRLEDNSITSKIAVQSARESFAFLHRRGLSLRLSLVKYYRISSLRCCHRIRFGNLAHPC